MSPKISTRTFAAALAVMTAFHGPVWAASSVVRPVVPGRATVAPIAVPIVRLQGAPLSPTALSAPSLSPLSVPSISPLASPAFSPVVAPALAPSAIAPNAAVSIEAPVAAQGPIGRVAAAAKEIGASIMSALHLSGPIKDASTENASGLGSNIQKMLSGEVSKSLSGSVEVPGGGKETPRPSGLTPSTNQNRSQQLMLRTLEQVAAVYTEHYAPIEWKHKQMGVDLVKEYQSARAKVLANPNMGQREFQKILADFVAATKDYHAGIQFASTESSELPIAIRKADGAYRIASIDREALPEDKFPFQLGDEVVEFGGRKVADVAAELNRVPNTAETDARISEGRLTTRSRRGGFDVPTGDIALKVRGKDGVVKDITLTWKHKEELVPVDSPVRDGGVRPETEEIGGIDFTLRPGAAAKAAFKKAMRALLPAMKRPTVGPEADNGFTVGGKKSFVPKLGEVVWELPAEIAAQLPITAYIYKDAQGRKMGYLRIPDYMGEAEHLQVIAQIIAMFEKKTDGLVLDQVNNPGGSLFYMYGILSMLTDKPLAVPKHRMLIDESDAMQAAELLKQAEEGGAEAEEALSEEMVGFQKPVDKQLEDLKFYANFVLSQLKDGKRLTDPVALFGVDEIEPNEQVHYTKPIVVLINELDFSCGDFFPAILQDNKRATLFGVRTSGAGGAVKSAEFPNQQGVTGFSYTWTFAQRLNGDPIENLGVKPDVDYQYTERDLREGFAGYAEALQKTIADRVAVPKAKPKPAEGEAPAVVRISEEGWKNAMALIELKGQDVDGEEAKTLTDTFALPDGASLRVIQLKARRGGTVSSHALIAYGKDGEVEGYLLLASEPGQTLAFWLSPEGVAIMAGELGADGKVVDVPLEDVSEALAAESEFWEAAGKAAAKPKGPGSKPAAK